MYRRFFKRPLDVLCALLALTVCAPLYVLLALLVRVKLGSPILFSQQRPGLHGTLFTLYKFRTMTDERDENGELLPDDVRLTAFGKFLRSTSLDELPEAVNILKGDMSVVGPRPLLVENLPLYNERQRRRHDVRPGLSGLAQVNGRNAITWDQKFAHDLAYVDNITFAGDVKVVLKTLWNAVARRDDAHTSTGGTMEKFTGSTPEDGE